MGPICTRYVSPDLSSASPDGSPNKAPREYFKPALQLYSAPGVHGEASDTTQDKELREHVKYTLRFCMHQTCPVVYLVCTRYMIDVMASLLTLRLLPLGRH